MRDSLFPPFSTIWPKGQIGYFRNAPSENQWANRGVQFLFVVVVGGSLCSHSSSVEAEVWREGGSSRSFRP